MAIAALLLVPLARAQEDRLPPPVSPRGFPVGPVYFTPFVGFGLSWESNPFYQTDADAEGDYIARLNPALEVMLPFRKSYVRAGYEMTFRRFAQTEVTNTDSDNLFGELSLQFSTLDRLVFFGSRSSGASELLNFDGGEATYDGTPFRYGVYTLGAERDVAGHLGYEVTATWNRLSFDETDVNFFEYHGYDLTGDAYVPLSAHLWVLAGAKVRRFDHQRTDDPPDVVFRQEQSETLRAGVRGQLAGDRIFHVVLAYDWASYPGGLGSDFQGVVGDAAVSLPIGPTTHLELTADRRRWSSFYGDNNYYVAGSAGIAVVRQWLTGSEAGVRLVGGRSTYPDPESIAAGGPHRHDHLGYLEVYGLLALKPQFGLRFSYEGQFRSSNVPFVEYGGQTAGLQLVYGWR